MQLKLQNWQANAINFLNTPEENSKKRKIFYVGRPTNDIAKSELQTRKE